MRFVKLTGAELVTFQDGRKNDSQFQFRNRCQCLVLSHQGKTVFQLIPSSAFKKLGYSFRRVRTSLKHRQAGFEREAKQAALKTLWRLLQTDSIDLYFADESSVSMIPCLPYAWQAKGQQIEIFRQRDKKVNLFGIFRPANVAVTYRGEGNINSKFLIRSINDFCQYLDKPTVLVIDNAPTHRSKLFSEQLSRWEEKGLYIFFLPKYSPHLNIAQTFWRKAK